MGQTVRTEFAQWLRDQLRSQGWMVSDFAVQVGVRPSAVYRWTAGQRAPTDSQVDKIAVALRIAPEVIWEALARSGVTPDAPPPATGRPRARPTAPPGPVSPPAERPFARWLRAQLDCRSWSAGFFARRSDLDPVTVRAWLGGVREPASVQFSRVASALDADVALLRGLMES